MIAALGLVMLGIAIWEFSATARGRVIAALGLVMLGIAIWELGAAE